jgi:coenzyme F420-reducing hydrogenase alpha subunit
MSKGRGRTIRVGALARVEGEGGLLIKTKGQRVTQVQLDIYEPPRFFEAFLRGRHFSEVPDITARICGICPVAHQMSSVQAIEQALGITPDPQVRALRRLIYCGEWIESHVLHVAMLHAPDFLGYEGAVDMARDHPELVRLALDLKKVGNDLVRVIGGREIHPVNVRVGGFYRLPSRQELTAIRERLLRARDRAGDLLRAASAFEFPDFEQDYEFVALRHPGEYPFNEGRLVSNRGLDIADSDFEDHFREEHVPHSNALHAVNKERGAYHVGPLARYSLNFDRLPPVARDAAAAAGLGPECRNPFKSILVRGVETVYACEEAVRLIDAYQPPASAFVDAPPRAGIGHGCSEAPRGILYHRYRLDEEGLVAEARIVPPTAQNLKTIENDLWHLVPRHLDLPPAQLAWRCEQAVRNYDPCISCATHFLRLRLERE